MVSGANAPKKSAKLSKLRRMMYSATGLAVIGSAVAVLGAPLKWG